jgi:hypothetical protein
MPDLTPQQLEYTARKLGIVPASAQRSRSFIAAVTPSSSATQDVAPLLHPWVNSIHTQGSPENHELKKVLQLMFATATVPTLPPVIIGLNPGEAKTAQTLMRILPPANYLDAYITIVAGGVQAAHEILGKNNDTLPKAIGFLPITEEVAKAPSCCYFAELKDPKLAAADTARAYRDTIRINPYDVVFFALSMAFLHKEEGLNGSRTKERFGQLALAAAEEAYHAYQRKDPEKWDELLNGDKGLLATYPTPDGLWMRARDAEQRRVIAESQRGNPAPAKAFYEKDPLEKDAHQFLEENREKILSRLDRLQLDVFNSPSTPGKPR